MSLLFIVEDKKVSPHTETLLIFPFKEIWERDESPNKENAMEEFAYIEFVSSMKKSNPYAGYEEVQKREKVKEHIITRNEWEPDTLVEEAIVKCKSFQHEASPTYSYYMAAKLGANKMQTFFNTFDMNEKNERSGNPIYKPKDITQALNDTAKVLENLNTMKEKVEQELFESTRMKGQKEISPFANPESLDDGE